MPKAILDSSFLAVVTMTGFFVASCPAWAGPDAGSQLRRYQDETQRRIAPRSADVVIPTPPAQSRSKTAASASAARMLVSGFTVHGVTRFSQDAIADVLKPFIGKELDTEGIHAAADAVNTHYRKAGYFMAMVFIPPQEVSGTIQLDVYEGYLDNNGIEVVNKGKRVDSSIVRGILEANIHAEEPIHRASIERALLIAEDLPGVTTSSTLYPGEYVGTARLRTTLNDLPMISGNIDADNFGIKATGQTRLGTTLYLNSPGQVGDQMVARLVTSGHGSNYAYLNYLRPVSPYGTRLGLSVDYFDYDADYLTSLGYAEGRASDSRIFLTHPVIRSRHGNLSLRADLSQLNIADSNDLQINAKRKINAFTFALNGDIDHDRLAPALSLFGASITIGNVNIEGNAAYQTIDRATADTDGSFTRFNFNASRSQPLSNLWSLYGRVSGQLASGNLDNSQKMYIGGAASVAGYPTGEIGGDQGLEISAELRRDFAVPWGGTLVGGLFYQQGWLTIYKSPWTGWQGTNPIIENDLTLKSIGVSLAQTLPGTWVLRGMLGLQLGDNPVRDPVTGAASDGGKEKYRAWFQVIRYF